jgi:hypothetical protein
VSIRTSQEEGTVDFANLGRTKEESACFRVSSASMFLRAFRNEIDKAFEWLERAYEERDPGTIYCAPNLFLGRSALGRIPSLDGPGGLRGKPVAASPGHRGLGCDRYAMTATSDFAVRLLLAARARLNDGYAEPLEREVTTLSSRSAVQEPDIQPRSTRGVRLLNHFVRPQQQRLRDGDG